MDTKYQLTKEGITELEKMANEGAKKASKSLSSMINQETKVEALGIRVLDVEKISEIIGSPEEMVTTITLKIKGEAQGNLMLIYPQQAALNVVDLLAKREIGSTTQLSELDKSALKESGNIISGSFLAAISNYLAINMIESIPDIATDMLKATIDYVLAEFAKREIPDVVAFEIDFEMATLAEAGKIRAYFVLLLDTQSSDKMLGSLKKISGGQQMRT
jgi:chemotaxis protein CheC